MQTTEIRETWTALYARLSLDDGNVGESMSIQSQKAILTRKAEELGIYNYQFYVDDGYSGTNFNRPSFQQMIADIEAGKVTCVITKDLSRLGRNYLESGAYIEVFFRYGISPSMTVWILQTAGRWILPRLRTFLMSFIQGMFPKR